MTKNGTLDVETDPTETVRRIRLPPDLGFELDALLKDENLGFTSWEHLIKSALWSFVGYKKRQVERMRRDAEAFR